MDHDLRRTNRIRDGSLIRVAAVGDLHAGRESRGQLRPLFLDLASRADVLLIAGDLTQHGQLEEGRVLAEELGNLGIPTVAVLGNHDYQDNADQRIRDVCEANGIRTLEGESLHLDLDGCRVGVAGVKGFGGGFAGACGTEFGEPEMKAFIHHSKVLAGRLRSELARLDGDVRIALTHYSPIKDTLMGERLEIYPFLGSYLLSEAIDEASCDFAVHGHAHRGTEHGVTGAGVPVRNVARTVIRAAYKVYCVHVRGEGGVRLTDALRAGAVVDPRITAP